MRLLGEAATATPSGRTGMENESKTIKVAMKKNSSELWVVASQHTWPWQGGIGGEFGVLESISPPQVCHLPWVTHPHLL